MWSQKVVVRVVEVVEFDLRGLRANQEFELMKVAETVAELDGDVSQTLVQVQVVVESHQILHLSLLVVASAHQIVLPS